MNRILKKFHTLHLRSCFDLAFRDKYYNTDIYFYPYIQVCDDTSPANVKFYKLDIADTTTNVHNLTANQYCRD